MGGGINSGFLPSGSVYDHERDNDLKKRLFEVMQKYGIK